MLQDTKRIDEPKEITNEWQSVDVALHHMQIRAMLQVGITGIDRARKIQCHDLRSGIERHLGKATRATATIQNPLAGKLLRFPCRGLPETFGRNRLPGVAVYLGLTEQIPLHAEVIGIARFRDKTGNEFADGVSVLSILRNQPATPNPTVFVYRGLQFQSLARLRTAE